jgi:hypothetical protein
LIILTSSILFSNRNRSFECIKFEGCWWHFFRGGEGINTAIAFNFVPHPSKSPPQPFNSFKKGGSGPKFWGKPNGAGEKIRTGS